MPGSAISRAGPMTSLGIRETDEKTHRADAGFLLRDLSDRQQARGVDVRSVRASSRIADDAAAIMNLFVFHLCWFLFFPAGEPVE